MKQEELNQKFQKEFILKMIRRKSNPPDFNPKELSLSLYEIVTLSNQNELKNIFNGKNGVGGIKIRRIISPLTGVYNIETGEVRCEFNTDGIQSIVGDDFEIYTHPRKTPIGIKYYLYMELKGDKNA